MIKDKIKFCCSD